MPFMRNRWIFIQVCLMYQQELFQFNINVITIREDKTSAKNTYTCVPEYTQHRNLRIWTEPDLQEDGLHLSGLPKIRERSLGNRPRQSDLYCYTEMCNFWRCRYSFTFFCGWMRDISFFEGGGLEDKMN